MPKNDPNRTYIGVLPLLIEFFATQPIGSCFSFEKLAEQTGFSYRQVRTSLRHAHESGRLSVPPAADSLGVQWNGLGANAKLADRDRLVRVPARFLNEQHSVGVATEDIAAGSSGVITLRPAESYGVRHPSAQLASPAASYTLVRELKDGALLLEDGDGELYKAVRI
jgi:hypothetical protein